MRLLYRRGRDQGFPDSIRVMAPMSGFGALGGRSTREATLTQNQQGHLFVPKIGAT